MAPPSCAAAAGRRAGRGVSIVSAAALLAAATTFAAAPAPVAPDDGRPAETGSIREELAAALRSLQDPSMPADQARRRTESAFDAVITREDGGDIDLIRDAALALRIVRLVEGMPPATRAGLVATLERSPRLAWTIAFLARSDVEGTPDPAALLDRFRRERGDRLEAWAPLVAAICVVHDRPFSRRVNEQVTLAPDPVALLDYFTAHAGSMVFPLRSMPAETLLHVVDVTSSIDELRWALRQHRADPDIGRRFFDVGYDRRHFRTGEEKRVAAEGYTLENIRLYGGICADQAFFASSVGKAIGVPTAYCVGRAANVGHAWVGFLDARERPAAWNFDAGRYESYQGVRGTVIDPQTRRAISDAHLALKAVSLRTADEADRLLAHALVDAAHRLAPPPAAPRGRRGGAGRAGAAAPAAVADPRQAQALRFAEQALVRDSGNLRGWQYVTDLAKGGLLAPEEARRWADVVVRLFGRDFPDVQFELLDPLVGASGDARARESAYEALLRHFAGRMDLVAAIGMRQAALHAERGDLDGAASRYRDIALEAARVGPVALDALERLERVLDQAGRPDLLVPILRDAWERSPRPPRASDPFLAQSNWYRMGTMLADRHERSGNRREAAFIRQQLESRSGGGS
ncbi:MAG: hypothetical protein KF817_08525 [Phycisphaeraceae bacterium]|nr:hypothetical protein [Phycisphaeraceae bacterium]